jgi:hypothetical protein
MSAKDKLRLSCGRLRLGALSLNGGFQNFNNCITRHLNIHKTFGYGLDATDDAT